MVGEWGHSVEWSGGIEIGADELWRRALEAAGHHDTVQFLDWRMRHGLSLAAAAQALGLSRRMVPYYSSGSRPVPRTVLLACRGGSIRLRPHESTPCIAADSSNVVSGKSGRHIQPRSLSIVAGFCACRHQVPQNMKRHLQMGPFSCAIATQAACRKAVAASGRLRPTPGLLLRCAQTLATRFERKHQRTAAPVPVHRPRPVGHLASQAQPHRQAMERTSLEEVSLRNTHRTLSAMCCVDQLNPPPKPDGRLP